MNVDAMTDALLLGIRETIEAALPASEKPRLARLWLMMEPALRAQARPAIERKVERMKTAYSTEHAQPRTSAPSSSSAVPAGTELIGSVNLGSMLSDRAQILAIYDKLVEVAGEMYAILETYNEYAGSCRFSFGEYSRTEPLLVRKSTAGDLKTKEAFTKCVDAGLWRYAMEKTQLYDIMPVSKRKQWTDMLSRLEMPAFTAEAVFPTFAELSRGSTALAADAVEEVFRNLSWDHKTNSPIAFGNRVIGRHFEYFADLYRIFHLLDGKPQPADKWTFRTILEDAAKNQVAGFRPSYGEIVPTGSWISIPFMRYKQFGNGNIHVEFTRPDLVEKMNQMLGQKYPRAIPAPDPHKGRNRR